MSNQSTYEEALELGKGVTEWRLPLFVRLLGSEKKNLADKGHIKEWLEKRFDLLARLLAEYPNGDTEKMAKDYGLHAKTIVLLAHQYGVYKSRERRSEICTKNGDNPRSRRAFWVRFRKNH